MANIGLIACTKSKATKTSAAALLYQSPLFKKSLLYSLSNTDRSYILSAKHGVLELGDVIEPYEVSIKHLSVAEKKLWADRVGQRLTELVKPSDSVYLLAGLDYSRPLEAALRKIGCKVVTPLSGLSLGHRLRRLTKLNDEADLFAQFALFYRAMSELYVGQKGGRTLGDSTGKMDWPTRGVYFLFEPGELLSTNKFRPLVQRVIRIGTHAVSKGSKATLWNRLSTHRGVISGGGSHRSSIFRLHTGAAIMRKEKEQWDLSSWGVGQVADAMIQESEIVLERRVSELLGYMTVLWLDVPDDPSPHSDRSYIERNSIGLLSRIALLTSPQSEDWLGNWSKHVQIALSGLWNLNHLYERPDAHFTDVLASYVDITLGKKERPAQSLAPVAWYRKHPDSSQLSLFADDSAKASANGERSA